MQKVILYYKFVPLPDPHSVRGWQRELCKNLGLKGRIIVSKQGINGTLAGDIKQLRQYRKEMNEHPLLSGITYKWSDSKENPFPRLSVKVRDELVAFWKPEELEVNEKGVVGGGKHLKPKQVHKLVEERGDEVVFFDGRNAYEAEIGKFKDAIVPNVKNTRDFAEELESGKYDDIKDKPIVTYCTGGIRCEVLSTMMMKRGFKEVYQIDGGIAKYGEAYGDDGLWDGKLYVFDDRQVTAFSDKAQDRGTCVHCQAKTSNFMNCANRSCNRLVLSCKDCFDNTTCSQECAEALVPAAA